MPAAEQPQKMKTKLPLFIVSIIAAALAGFLLREDLYQALLLVKERIGGAYLCLILLTTAVNLLNEPLRWFLLLRSQQQPFPRCYHLSTTTAFVSYTFPAHTGLLARVLLAKRLLGLDLATTGAVLAVDNALLYLSWFLYALVGAFVLLSGPSITIPTGVFLYVIPGILLLVLLVRYCPPIRSRLPKLREGMKKVWKAAAAIPTHILLINFLLLLADVFVYGVRHWVAIRALGGNVELLTVTLIVGMSVSAGFLSLMPLGLGAYDLSLGFLLHGLGLPDEIAIALPLINRIAIVSLSLLLGFVSFNLTGLRRDQLQNPDAESTSTDTAAE